MNDMMTVDDVKKKLKVSSSTAYNVMRKINLKMEKEGYMIISGRVNSRFFNKEYGFEERK